MLQGGLLLNSMNEIIRRRIENCRICESDALEPIVSLGDIAVSDFVDEQNVTAQIAPLDLVLCDSTRGGCGLLQLRHTVSPENMYRTYWYRSGMNATMTRELEAIARTAERIASLVTGDYVIDIGANDGTLLRGYTVHGLQTIGFEPAQNLGQYNQVGTTEIIQDFFNVQSWRDRHGAEKAKVITAIAMFYDLDDPNAFVGDLASCLDQAGVAIIQMSYLPLMLSQNAFDNICHEHLEYYSLLSLEYLLARHGLEVFDVELNDVNGGSYRAYIRHRGAGVTAPVGADVRVASLRAYEEKLKLETPEGYADFVRRLESLKKKTCEFIRSEVEAEKKVYVYGASTKGNTLLQYYGLDSTLITAAAERNSDKWGKKTVATHIPIISEADARAQKPDYFLVLPWHFLDEFLMREKEYLKGGGAFIVPLPEFRVIRL